LWNVFKGSTIAFAHEVQGDHREILARVGGHQIQFGCGMVKHGESQLIGQRNFLFDDLLWCQIPGSLRAVHAQGAECKIIDEAVTIQESAKRSLFWRIVELEFATVTREFGFWSI